MTTTLLVDHKALNDALKICAKVIGKSPQQEVLLNVALAWDAQNITLRASSGAISASIIIPTELDLAPMWGIFPPDHGEILVPASMLAKNINALKKGKGTPKVELQPECSQLIITFGKQKTKLNLASGTFPPFPQPDLQRCAQVTVNIYDIIGHIAKFCSNDPVDGGFQGIRMEIADQMFKLSAASRNRGIILERSAPTINQGLAIVPPDALVAACGLHKPGDATIILDLDGHWVTLRQGAVDLITKQMPNKSLDLEKLLNDRDAPAVLVDRQQLVEALKIAQAVYDPKDSSCYSVKLTFEQEELKISFQGKGAQSEGSVDIEAWDEKLKIAPPFVTHLPLKLLFDMIRDTAGLPSIAIQLRDPLKPLIVKDADTRALIAAVAGKK